jgi:hypothetical protein
MADTVIKPEEHANAGYVSVFFPVRFTSLVGGVVERELSHQSARSPENRGIYLQAVGRLDGIPSDFPRLNASFSHSVIRRMLIAFAPLAPSS